MTSRCDSMPGMCGRDPMCRDTHCPGRPDLRQQSGGAYVDTALGVEAALPSAFTDRDEIVFAGREPTDWQRIGWRCFWIAFALYMLIAAIGRMT